MSSIDEDRGKEKIATGIEGNGDGGETNRSQQSLSISRLGMSGEVGGTRSLTVPGAMVTLSWIDIKYRIRPPKPNIFQRLIFPKKFKAWREAEGTQILGGVLGEIRPGELIGIMGGSGAGKTTMLNILAGKVVGGEPTGTVLVNGQPRDEDVWPYILSYVEQEDILDENLTVREMIRFAVDMRNPKSACDDARRTGKTNKLLKSLGLEGIADRNIGTAEGSGISGGERKRVSIALELAAERRVVFLDEPTTGLDAASSLSLLEIIGKLAKKHRLSVIMSIHQPSGKMLQHLDKILLLSLGRTIFFGSLPETIQHLQSLGHRCPKQENPADWILDVISVDNSGGGRNRQESLQRIGELQQVWAEIERENTGAFAKSNADAAAIASGSKRNSGLAATFRKLINRSSATSIDLSDGESERGIQQPRHARTRSINSLFLRRSTTEPTGPTPPPSSYFGYALSRPAEFAILLRRYVLIEMRNRHTNMFLFGEFFVLSIVVGFVFFQLTTDNFGGFQSRIGLFSTMPALIIGLISVDLMVLFVSKRRLIVRERFSRLYRLSDAYTANVLALLPLRLVSVTIFATIVYYLTGLRTDSFTYFLIYLGIILLVTLFSTFFGIMVAAVSTGSLMAAVVRMIFAYIFMLFGGNLARTTDITPIVSWLRFLSPYFYCLQALIQNEAIGLTIAGQDGIDFVELYGLNQFSIMWNAGALMIMSAATFIFGYIGLSMTTRPKYIVI